MENSANGISSKNSKFASLWVIFEDKQDSLSYFDIVGGGLSTREDL